LRLNFELRIAVPWIFRLCFTVSTKDVASNNFPFWGCLGKCCAALPFVHVASHTALRAPCTAFAQAAPKREVNTRHILTIRCDFLCATIKAISKGTSMSAATNPIPSEPTADMPSIGLVFTDSAASKVRELVDEEGNPNLKLRVFVQGGGCSGFQYGFTFDEITNEDDTQMSKNGVTLLIDAMSLQYLVGAEIDYKDDLQGAQFVIKNPNATTTCGCGSSFSV
jgi:iron-sulfur cluster insertion protein